MSLDNLIQIQPKRYTSRTAVLTAKTCMYKRYLMFHAEGGGFTTEKTSLDLLIGTCVHRGLQHLLEHCRVEHADGSFEEACIDEAVAKAYEIWQSELAKKQIWLHSGEDERLDWIIAEQECLFEGLIRAWAIYRLPDLLENYEILEVEKEEVLEDFSVLVTFLGKADYLAREKSTNRIIIGSFKTASQYAEVTTRDILHDMQGVSEWYLVQDRLNRLFDTMPDILLDKEVFIQWKEANNVSQGIINYFNSFQLLRDGDRPKVFAVQYEYLLKGQRKQDPYNSGIYKQQSFLCHPIKSAAVQRIFMGTAGGDAIDPSEYKWIHNKKGPMPKGLEKIDVWNDIGIKNWITMLNSGQIQPEEGHAFAKIIIIPDLVLRSEEELREWKISTSFSETEIAKHLAILEALKEKWVNAVDTCEVGQEAEIDEINRKLIQELIWAFFPKNTQSCHNYYGKDCPFVFHCHEFTSLEDAINAGNLQVREPHHELELKSHIEKGLITDASETL